MVDPFAEMLSGRVSIETLVDRIANAIRTRAGLSLLRLGDGEGTVLIWREGQNREDIASALNIWFGRTDLSDDELDSIATALRQAVRSADIVGLPTRYQLAGSHRYQMVLEGVRDYDLLSPKQLRTDANAHWYLQWSGALAYLLGNLDEVGVIGCRNIGPLIAEAFGLRNVRTYLVRGEHGFPGEVSEAHWPTTYSKIMRDLRSIAPGSMFLVGAGVLGKLYCHKIQEMGGIALDVGSILDSWARVPSRKRYELNSPAFTFDHFKTPVASLPEMKLRLAENIAAFDIRDATF